MSAAVIARGVLCGCMPWESVYISPGQTSAVGPSTSAPAGRLATWVTRPVCMSCTKILPPLAWTASVTAFQPRTCASLNSPGMRG